MKGPESGSAITGPVLASLRRDREIERITVATTADIDVNGHQVRLLAATAIRGPALISVVDGRLPEVTARSCWAPRPCAASARGRADWSRWSSPTREAPGTRLSSASSAARRSRRASAPAGWGAGPPMTLSALTDTQCPPGPGRPACQRHVQRGAIYLVLARAAPGRPPRRRWPGMSADTLSSQVRSQEPIELVNFGRVGELPAAVRRDAGAVRGGDDGAPAAGQRFPPTGRGWLAEGARVRPVSGRGGSQLAGHRGDPGRDRGRGAAGDRGRQSALAGVCHELRSGAANSGGGAPCGRCSPSGCSPQSTCSPSSPPCWPRDHAPPSCCGPSKGHPPNGNRRPLPRR